MTGLAPITAADPIPAFSVSGGQITGDLREAINRAVTAWLARRIERNIQIPRLKIREMGDFLVFA